MTPRNVSLSCFAACFILVACTKCAWLQRAEPAEDACLKADIAELVNEVSPNITVVLQDGITSEATQSSLEGLAMAVGVPAVVCAVEGLIGAAHGPAQTSGTAPMPTASPKATMEAHKFLARHRLSDGGIK